MVLYLRTIYNCRSTYFSCVKICTMLNMLYFYNLFVDISVRLKCKTVDKFEHLRRLDEELILIKKEMLQYLKYYKDSVIAKLKTEIKDLERNLNSGISKTVI